jgi:elongator complex protein 6
MKGKWPILATMPPLSRIPPLLHPYITLPRDDSILLVTSTLGASANWLVVRFLCDALIKGNDGRATGTPQHGGMAGESGASVILVSWMREYEFWKQEARKGGGVDLEKCRKEGRFSFVDGLSALFLEAGSGEEVEKKRLGVQSVKAAQTLPMGGAPPGRAIPARGPPAASASPTMEIRRGTATTTTSASVQNPGLYTLQSADLSNAKATILTALSHIPTSDRKTLLVLDNPDILLATSPTPARTLTDLTSLFLTLHTQISHLLIHTQSDTPLLTPSTPLQPIEQAQHNLVVKLAHMSRRILSVRVLDTGVARDVSGVLRVTENGSSIGGVGLDLEDDRESERKESRGGEVLYKVGGDGGVKVFERGAGGDA